MGIENIMYFALGGLAASLLALAILPAVWRRAVRLTKKRIEAATPITMSEFRADKDQLRAEFALSTRRLEMNVEPLRMRDREYADKVTQLETAREALRGKTPRSIDVDGKALSGDYNTDMDVLLQKLETERKRAGFLETQNRSL